MKKMSGIVGIYLLYLCCQRFTLLRALLLLGLCDLVNTVLTILSLMPLFELEGRGLTVSLVTALIKLSVLVALLFSLFKTALYDRCKTPRNFLFYYIARCLIGVIVIF